MYYAGFQAYLTSEINSVYNSDHTSRIYQDMKQPITHYFIASSHNTYLKSDQLQGESSVEAYIIALDRGCRCVELDCWDGKDGEPIIYHGHTLTSQILFRDVILAIRNHAFAKSPYPVILSFENHCSVKQQVRMAAILTDVLGTAGMLPKPFILDNKRGLPSPEQLKNKVLLKGSMLSTPDGGNASDSEYEDEEFDEDDDDFNNEEPKKGEKPKKEKEKKKDKQEAKKKKKTAEKTAKQLSDLIHLRAVHFPGFDKVAGETAPWEMSSFSELSVRKKIKSDAERFAVYNVRQMARVYPKGTRFNSSNYNPVPAWTVGCQLVALNYQTGDWPMFLNSGKFRDNGGCGYLLKPNCLLSGKKGTTHPKRLTVKIISGWQLPKVSYTTEGEIIDPYVNLRMCGIPSDEKKYKTKVINNNGFNPIWNETTSFDLKRPDLAILLIEVIDQDTLSKDDFIGYCSVPVESIMPGHRMVYLMNARDQLIAGASLLMQFTYE